MNVLPSFLTTTPSNAPAPVAVPVAAPAANVQPAWAPDRYQPAPPPPMALRPVLDANGQVVAYVQVPAASPPRELTAAEKNQQAGRTVLGFANTGLGVAGVFAPPLLPIAAVGAVVQSVDGALGHPIAEGVGAATRFVGQAGEFVYDGVVGVGKGIGRFFGKLF